MSLTHLLKSLQAPGVEQDFGHRRYYGVYTGVVTANNDPEGRYRVRVKIHHLHDQHETWWCRITTQMAGADMGAFWLPEVNDEVLLAAVSGGEEQFVVIGSLWNGSDTPIDVCDEKNDNRWWKTRSGHIFKFCDGDDTFIMLQTTGGHLIELHDGGGNVHINITDSSGGNFIHINTDDNDINIECANNFNVKAATDINMECGGNMTFKVGADFTAEVGANTKIDTGVKAEFLSGSGTDIVAGGILKEEAPLITLN